MSDNEPQPWFDGYNGAILRDQRGGVALADAQYVNALEARIAGLEKKWWEEQTDKHSPRGGDAMTEQQPQESPWVTVWLQRYEAAEDWAVLQADLIAHINALEARIAALEADCIEAAKAYLSMQETSEQTWRAEVAALTQEQPRHAYKPLSRGDHAITVRLCYDCDKWHADDDSLLYNEGHKREWEARIAALTQERDEALRQRDNARAQSFPAVPESERLLIKERDSAEAVAAHYAKALVAIGQPAIQHMTGNSTMCLRCGFETFHEKDGEVEHEKDCVQQYAARLVL